MAEDLGQDVGEYLLNQRNDWLRIANSFLDLLRGNSRYERTNTYADIDAKKSDFDSAEEVVSLDFETSDAAHEVSGMLNELGFENYVVASSVVMRASDLDSAADQCSKIAEAAGRKAETVLDNHEEKALSDQQVNVEAGSKGIPDATPKQLAFIERLHEQGHIADTNMPDDLTKLNIREAASLIKEGTFCRDAKKDAKTDPVHIKEEGAAERAASQRLAEERSGRAHEKVIARGEKVR